MYFNILAWKLFLRIATLLQSGASIATALASTAPPFLFAVELLQSILKA